MHSLKDARIVAHSISQLCFRLERNNTICAMAFAATATSSTMILQH